MEKTTRATAILFFLVFFFFFIILLLWMCGCRRWDKKSFFFLCAPWFFIEVFVSRYRITFFRAVVPPLSYGGGGVPCFRFIDRHCFSLVYSVYVHASSYLSFIGICSAALLFPAFLFSLFLNSVGDTCDFLPRFLPRFHTLNSLAFYPPPTFVFLPFPLSPPPPPPAPDLRMP